MPSLRLPQNPARGDAFGAESVTLGLVRGEIRLPWPFPWHAGAQSATEPPEGEVQACPLP